MREETRPRIGMLLHADGTCTPVRFVPTEDPLAFLAVDRDGGRIRPGPGDALRIDVLGTGQTVVVEWAADSFIFSGDAG